MPSWVRLPVAVLLSSCMPNLDLADDAQISCESAAQCPAEWVCHAGSCRPAATLDTVAPDLAGTPSVNPPLGRAGDAFTIELGVTKALVAPPWVVLQVSGSPQLACDELEAMRYRCTYTATGNEFGGADGTARFDVTLTDTSRNTTVRESAGSFALDFHAPELVFVSALYTPGPDNPLTRAAFAADERILRAFPGIGPLFRRVLILGEKRA